MKIVVCGSMTNYLKMLDLKTQLSLLGHEVVLPNPSDKSHISDIKSNKYEDTYELKIKYDYIKKHYCHIVQSDCVLIANFDKNGIKNYIGGNAFLEIGYAHVLNRPIFLLNPVPDIEFIYNEILATQPKIIDGDLNKIRL
jgi:hypothetical protein